MGRIENRPKIDVSKPKKKSHIENFVSDKKNVVEEETKRQGFHIPIKLSEALGYWSTGDKKTMSEIIVKLIRKNIPKKYLNMAYADELTNQLVATETNQLVNELQGQQE